MRKDFVIDENATLMNYLSALNGFLEIAYPEDASDRDQARTYVKQAVVLLEKWRQGDFPGERLPFFTEIDKAFSAHLSQVWNQLEKEPDENKEKLPLKFFQQYGLEQCNYLFDFWREAKLLPEGHARLLSGLKPRVLHAWQSDTIGKTLKNIIVRKLISECLMAHKKEVDAGTRRVHANLASLMAGYRVMHA
jgi:hypothetical protein